MGEATEAPPKLLTIGQVAARLRFHPDSVRQMAREGRLAGAVRLCGRWRVHAGAFEEWLQEQLTAAEKD